MNFKKITASSLLLAGIAMSPHVLADESFHGHIVDIRFEEWASNDVLLDRHNVLLGVKHWEDVLASDLVYPDLKDFYTDDQHADYSDWDIDFNQNRIELTYTPIEANDPDNQYRYETPKGFHFQDSENSLPDIINVIVDDTFAPFGFDPELVTFDANNIYVNLKRSMCLYKDNDPIMGIVLPLCTNPMSPTGYDNRINLTVRFAPGETNNKVIIDDATIDKLFDWRESKYPELFPTHQDSMSVNGYYARFYEGTGFYIGSLKGRLYLYHIHLAVMIELGEISHLVEEMNAEQNGHGGNG